MTDTCLSGGADGADLTWGGTAARYRHSVIHWTFAGHRSRAPRETLHMLSDDDLLLADPRLEHANRTLRRRWPVGSVHVANLLRRNWFQVATADACYGVSEIDSGGLVEGGTAWAVQMFIDRFEGASCPCWVFCQRQRCWFRWAGFWEAVDRPPRPSGTYAGIGTRKKFGLAGAEAISGVFA